MTSSTSGTSAAFTISGFGDEIAGEPSAQLDALVGMSIRHLDLRGAWDRNILDFSDDDVQAMRAALAAHGVKVACLASPIGKSPIDGPAGFELGRLDTAIRLAHAFETPLIRVFSYYHEGIAHADCRDEVIARLRVWAERAEAAGVTLLLENEGDLWGDTPDRLADIFASVGSPALRLTLDTGNFASLGIASHDVALPKLAPWLAHIQIKDVQRDVHKVVPAGQGDGQIPQVLAAAISSGYRGYLSLEPHLAVAGRAGGFSGAALFGTAAQALRSILAELGVSETAD
jgi:sugar phosphate isomerase/epimerase